MIGSSPKLWFVISMVWQQSDRLPVLENGSDRQQDRMLADELLQDPKERAEHVMLVDLARNDLDE